MVCFPSCEGVCSLHCYSNPNTAGSMSWVCISSAYVTDSVCRDNFVLSNAHVLPVYWHSKNAHICVEFRVDLHPGVPPPPMVWGPDLLTENTPPLFVVNACGLAQQMDGPSTSRDALLPGTKITDSEELVVASELSIATHKDVLGNYSASSALFVKHREEDACS